MDSGVREVQPEWLAGNSVQAASLPELQGWLALPRGSLPGHSSPWWGAEGLERDPGLEGAGGTGPFSGPFQAASEQVFPAAGLS